MKMKVNRRGANNRVTWRNNRAAKKIDWNHRSVKPAVIRMFHYGLFIKVQGHDVNIGRINRRNDYHRLTLMECSIPERDSRGRMRTYTGCVIKKKIDRRWFDIGLKGRPDCIPLIMKLSDFTTPPPPDRIFLMHGSANGTTRFESYRYRGHFLKTNGDKLCMDPKCLNHRNKRFEVIQDLMPRYRTSNNSLRLR